ncbi:hypothetical protein [Candidatus Pseudomonas adelgestsugas]
MPHLNYGTLRYSLSVLRMSDVTEYLQTPMLETFATLAIRLERS